MDPEASAPACLHSDNLPALFHDLGISLLLTSYQADRLMAVRSDGSEIDVLYQYIPKPMGLALAGDRLVLGSWAQVLDYRRQDEWCAEVDPSGQVDACYVPRSTLITGDINIHDIAWGEAGLWAVNSQFSCLVTLSPDYSFVPRWKPPFIETLSPDDICHLNGMAMARGAPAFVTSFSTQSTPDVWRRLSGQGALMRVADSAILFTDLVMPHSPRVMDDWVYFCESGEGRVWRCREDGSERTLVAELPGFTRGLDRFGSLLFVGLSCLRVSSGVSPLPLAQRIGAGVCGFWVIDLEKPGEVGWLLFSEGVSQVYDVVVVPDARYPHIVEWADQGFERLFRYPPLA